MLSFIGMILGGILDLFRQFLILARWIKILAIGALAIAMVYYGLKGIVSNLEQQSPRQVTYAALASSHPEAAWVRLEGATLRFADTIPEVKEIDAAPLSVPQHEGRPTSDEGPATKSDLESEFLIPVHTVVRGVPDLSQRPSIVLQTSDKELVRRAEAVARALRGISSPAERSRWERSHPGSMLAGRSFTGIARTAEGMTPHRAARLENLRVPANGDSVLLRDGEVPETLAPFIELGVGVGFCLLLAWMGVAMHRAHRESQEG